MSLELRPARHALTPNRGVATKLRILTTLAILVLPDLHALQHARAFQPSHRTSVQASDCHRHSEEAGNYDSDCPLCENLLNPRPALVAILGTELHGDCIGMVVDGPAVCHHPYEADCSIPRGPPVA